MIDRKTIIEMIDEYEKTILIFQNRIKYLKSIMGDQNYKKHNIQSEIEERKNEIIKKIEIMKKEAARQAEAILNKKNKTSKMPGSLIPINRGHLNGK